jgi:uncharacterized membrane protein
MVPKKVKKIFTENYSSNIIEIYKWLFQLLLFTATLYFVAIIKNIFKYLGQKDGFEMAEMSLILVVLCAVCWYVLKALRYPNLFSGVHSKTKLTAEILEVNPTKRSI